MKKRTQSILRGFPKGSPIGATIPPKAITVHSPSDSTSLSMDMSDFCNTYILLG